MSVKYHLPKLKKLPKLPKEDLFSRSRFSKPNLLIFAFIFAAVGGYFIYSSFASGFAASTEPENGTITSPATQITDATASGGKAVRFGTASITSCALPNYPDASCTGVPAGVTLTAYDGPMTVTTANAVIDGKNITGCIDIRASNVTIKNSKVLCTTGGTSTCSCAVSLRDGPGWNNWSLTIQDSEIDCGGDADGFGNSMGLGEGFMTVRRVDIQGCENGVDLNQNMDIQDSYIHDLRECCGSHTDGVQFADHYSPAGSGTVVNGVVNFTFIHNTVFSMKAGAPTDGNAPESYFTTSAIISGSINDTNVIIDDNLFGGGAYTIYCEQGGAAYHGVSEVKRNHFTRRFKSTVGFFGPSTECSNENTSGNVYQETGLPVPMD